MPAIAEPPKPSPPMPTPAPPAPAPAPTPSPEPKPAMGASDAFDDAFKDLDNDPVIAKPAKAEPKAEPKKEPVAAPKVDPAKPAAKKEPDAEPAPDTDDDNFEPPQVANANTLRGWALRMGKKAKAARQEIEQHKAKLRELESKATSLNGHQGDVKMLSEQLAAANKRIEEYESQVRLTKYERSAEYKEKWERPYTDAVNRAYRDIQELLVTDRKPNPDDPERPIETERQATKADFDAIYQQPLGQATKLAKQLFGDSYSLVLQHRQKIKEIAEGAYAAVEDYRTKGNEHEKESEVRSKQEQQFLASAWNKLITGFKAKAPEYFDDRPDDDEGNKMLNEGMDFADMAFDSDRLDKYPISQQVAIQARVRSWAGAFPRMRRDLLTLKAQLEEANATIESLRGSEPGKPAPAAQQPKAEPVDIFDDFEKSVSK